MKPSSLASLASFALVALSTVSAGAQGLPIEFDRELPGAYGPMRRSHARPMFRPMVRRAPVVIVAQPAPRPAPVVVVAPPPPCHPVVVAPPPPPSDEHGLLVLDSTPLVGGQSVMIEWGVGYYPGQVVAVNANGTVRVHYSSYSGMWDEDVARYRLRLPR